MSSGKYAAVVGAVNMDIGAAPFSELIPRDSNPGRVHVSPGGVGRNIAHNLRLLGVDTLLLTALGDDAFALRIKEDCSRLGIDLSLSIHVPDAATSTYLFVTNRGGDMELAVSDMEICAHITPSYLSAHLGTLNRADAVVFDTNIPAESIEWLCDNCRAPLFSDPVSVTKADKLLPHIGRLHTLKPNRMEAAHLTGTDAGSEAGVAAAAEKLLGTGLKQVFISLASLGLYASDGSESLFEPCCAADMKNATGGGDAMTAVLAWAHLRGLTLRDAARASQAAAAIAVESPGTINSGLSEEAVLLRAGL